MYKKFNRYTAKDYINSNQWHYKTSIWKARNIIKILERNKLKPKSICEIGCGGGEILKNLENIDYVELLDGYDISKEAFEVNRTKQNKKVSFYLKDVYEISTYYDLLLSIDVFEHVENYIEFIRENKKKAKYKIFHIPLEISINSIVSGGFIRARNDVGHLHYFTIETAIETLKDADLEIIDYFFTAPFESNGPPKNTLRSKILKYPRQLLFMFSPEFCSKTIGGCSIMVLAK